MYLLNYDVNSVGTITSVLWQIMDNGVFHCVGINKMALPCYHSTNFNGWVVITKLIIYGIESVL